MRAVSKADRLEREVGSRSKALTPALFEEPEELTEDEAETLGEPMDDGLSSR